MRRQTARRAGVLLGLLVLALVLVNTIGGNGEDEPSAPVVDSTGWSHDRKVAFWNDDLALRAIDTPDAVAIEIWKTNHEWAEEHGLPGQAESALRKILKLHPQDDWANEKRGYRLFVYKNHEIGEPYEWERKREILAVVDDHGGRAWVSPEQYDRLVALTKKEDEHLARITRDPRYRWTRHWIGSTRLDPAYGLYRFRVNDKSPPHLVFVQDTGKEADRKEVVRLVKRYGFLFREALDGWKTKVEPEIRKIPGHEDFELPTLDASDPNDPDPPPILKVWVFFDKKSFRNYQNRVIGRPLPWGTCAYYRRDNQWVTLHARRAIEEERFGRQDLVTCAAFRVATHQLRHTYTKLIKDRDAARRGEPATDFPVMGWKSHWFTVGLAELFGGADETTPDESWETFGPYHYHIRQHREALLPESRKEGLHWSLNEIVRIPNNSVLDRRVHEKSHVPAVQADLEWLFYAESWAFCHFLWHAEDGKYRKYFVRYLIEELHGESGFEVFARVFADICPGGDCSKLEPEVISYIEGL